jgi:hypothetical protein
LPIGNTASRRRRRRRNLLAVAGRTGEFADLVKALPAR